MEIVRENFSKRFCEKELFLTPRVELAKAQACSNIALVKYWGKRDLKANLPMASSLSLSLGKLGTSLTLSLCSEIQLDDEYRINQQVLSKESLSYKRLKLFLEPFRVAGMRFILDSHNSIPTAAGLASSASAFAAVSKALNTLFQWKLDDSSLSRLARLGSGSACRSMWKGFVHWSAGSREDGMDCFARPLSVDWDELRWAIIPIDFSKKEIGSTEAMELTVKSSPFISLWTKTVEEDVTNAVQAIYEKDFTKLGKISEASSMAMHALMLSARPSICYFHPSTIDVLNWIKLLRKEGLEVYASMDAGPNVKVLLRQSQESSFKEAFSKFIRPNLCPDLKIVNPFE